jgi:hypothetical protein
MNRYLDRYRAMVARTQVHEWNVLHPPGTHVRYWPGVRDGDGILSRTRSEALVLS